MRSGRRLSHLLGLFALLASLLAIPAATAAQQPGCADYSSTAAAQFALDINPALAPSLDPDGNGVACDHEGSTTSAAPTSTSLELPGEQTPAASTTQPQPEGTVDAVDQQPTTQTTTTQPGQPTPAGQTTQAGTGLDGRLGAQRASFEAVHGAPTEEHPSDTNPAIVGRVYAAPAGASDVFVIYFNDQASVIMLTAGQPAWNTTDAAAQITPYVPADVTTLPQPEPLPDGTLLLPVTSPTLATGVTADMMAQAGLPGVPGDMYILLVVDSTNLITTVELGLGNGDNVRAEAGATTTTTTDPQPTAASTTAPEPTAATTTTDPATFLQQARAEITQYRAEIDELMAILNAGTFTEPETTRLSEIIISWMAIDTTPLSVAPEHQQIATLLDTVHTDLSSVGMILFTVMTTGDTTNTQQAADTLARINANLTAIDQQLAALGA